LSELMLKVGEDAPTMCGEWNVGDLAAHLVVRENRPDALVGLIAPPLRGYTAKLEKAARDSHSFAELVEQVRTGPPRWNPIGLPGVRDRANVHEYFVHHEDVRRAQPGWHVRELSPQLSAGLWNFIRMMAPFQLHGIKATRVTLATPDGATRSVGPAKAPNQVTVTGTPGELLLYLSGRRSIAEVKVSGSPAGQARLAAASLEM
jgi:uncharacterized protein (TIGR03085 family)